MTMPRRGLTASASMIIRWPARNAAWTAFHMLGSLSDPAVPTGSPPMVAAHSGFCSSTRSPTAWQTRET